MPWRVQSVELCTDNGWSTLAPLSPILNTVQGLVYSFLKALQCLPLGKTRISFSSFCTGGQSSPSWGVISISEVSVLVSMLEPMSVPDLFSMLILGIAYLLDKTPNNPRLSTSRILESISLGLTKPSRTDPEDGASPLHLMHSSRGQAYQASAWNMQFPLARHTHTGVSSGGSVHSAAD